MPTILSFLSGRQITNDSGVPQAGAKVYHYRATTTTNLTVWQNSGASVPHAQPVVCDAGGFVPLIYVDDTFNWKIVVTTAADVTLPQYNFDNLPKAESDVSAVGFAPPLFDWQQITSSASPVALTAANAGLAYEADTTSGSITFNLPSAASVGSGKGFVFKKTASANSMIITPAGTETIDNVAGSLTITRDEQTVGIFSNGAEWYGVMEYGRLITLPTVQRFTSGTAQTYTPAAGVRFIRVRMVGGGGGGGAQVTNNGVAGVDSSFGSWTAIKGGGGTAGGGKGTGGTGGVDGTGTKIARLDGADGSSGRTFNPTFGGAGGGSVFGGAGAYQDATAGGAAKANTGSGGAAGGSSNAAIGGGGGAGEYVEFFMTAAQIGASQTYTVGTGGNGGAAGTLAGGNGAAGVIIVEEFY